MFVGIPKPKGGRDAGSVLYPDQGKEGVRPPLPPSDMYRRISDAPGATVLGRGKKPWPVNDGTNPLFNEFRERLRPREGDRSDDPDDPGGLTKKGISQELLGLLRGGKTNYDLPSSVDDLSEEQIEGILRAEFFDRPKIQRLADIPGLMQRAPWLVEQMFDAGVLHTPIIPGAWLQKALGRVLDTDLRVRNDDGDLAYDGIVGPRTRAAVARALEEPRKLVEVNDAIVEMRLNLMRNDPKHDKFGRGWEDRANSFRTENYRGGNF